MASEEDEGRTETSAKRLQKAFDEGDVPLGRDAPLVMSLAAAAAAMIALGGLLRTSLVRAVQEATSALSSTPFPLLPRLAAAPVAAAAAICAAAAAGSALVTLVQTKGTFWPDRWLPDFSRLFNPGRIAQLVPGKQALIELGLSVVKVVALGWAAWTSIHGDFLTLPHLLGATPAEQLAEAFAIVQRAGWRMLSAAALIAGADLAIVRWRYFKKMKITKQEAKREAKDDSGDPLIRGKRKRRHRELARGRARIEVPRADALLVNPTHVAVALRYRRDEGRAPRVTAKGKGVLAEYMRELARENAVPIVEDIPLARLLYRKVKVGREIPPQTYKAVATVLAFVYRITGRAAGGKGTAA
jgi:flagellar biosynthetic protein FlhB